MRWSSPAHQRFHMDVEAVYAPQKMQSWHRLTIENPQCTHALGRQRRSMLRGSLPFCHIRLTGRKPPPPPYPRQLRTLGDHLRKQRLDLGLLQSQVAEQLGVDHMTICNWEINRTSPQLRLIPKIITFLGYVPYDTQSGGLGKRIIACRRVMGLSQKELAGRLGVDPSTLARWESERGCPSEKHRERLLAFLNNLPAVRAGPRQFVQQTLPAPAR